MKLYKKGLKLRMNLYKKVLKLKMNFYKEFKIKFVLKVCTCKINIRYGKTFRKYDLKKFQKK